MSLLRPRLSLRFKIVLLIMVALAASLASYLRVGTSLIVSDKTSYIYDFNLAEVTAVSERIEARAAADRAAPITAHELRGNPQMSIAVFDFEGSLVGSRGMENVNREGLSGLWKEISGSEFATGARAWTAGNSEFLVAYNRIPRKKMTVIGLIPRELAFSAADSLVRRSVVLGLSIFLIVAGITLLLVRSITSQLRRIWSATQQVREGNFTTRVPETRSRDEIADLSRSFNAMAGRIEELMLETAQKARMEKELETAQQVQKTLFPREGFTHSALQIAGRTIPATECAGDWWNYQEVGGRLVVVIGDVTGHGVSAALVTAAAHGAFTLMMRDCRRTNRAPDLSELISDMNAAVRAASGGASTMTLLASILDLATGNLEYVNAAHRPLYLQRESAVQPLMEAVIPALGSSDEPASISPGRIALSPGDALLWFTDGLVECPNPEGRTLSTARVAKLLTRLCGAHPGAGELCAALVDESVRFLGDAYSARPDDISVVIGRVPADASFARPATPIAA